MIHHAMKTATIRDLRTRFLEVRKLLEREGEVVVTHRGKPVVVLRNYDARSERRSAPIAYYDRLRRRMPKPLTKAKRYVLAEVDRGER
jgi:antitoxin (DNA-binding transcriptional repressor) of toxin-antitoxin stability system